jgi:energy-coupling factor transporter ATP-binding protein EcfA2
VVEFAELGEFADLKLKNYSSGMLVRLAFSVMMQADADVLLIDEVLAVGDASFQQKCADAFHQMKEQGKTIVLITHEMGTVEEYCHRAMLIDDGTIQHIGDPGEVGRRYLRLNFERSSETGTHGGEDPSQSSAVRMVDAWIEDEGGKRVGSVEHAEEIRMRFEFEAKEDLPGLDLGFIVANADGVPIVQYGAAVGEEGAREISKGDLVRAESDLGNALAPGRYFVHCGVNLLAMGGIALYVERAIEFVVYGGPSDHGVIFLPHTTHAEIERGASR